MRKFYISSVVTLAGLALPALANAQSTAAGLQGVLQLVSKLANGVIGVLITIAIVVFFWGVIRYVLASGEAKGEGLQIMLWGIIAIFVMVSIWGLIKLLQNTLGVQNATSIVLPTGPEYTPH